MKNYKISPATLILFGASAIPFVATLCYVGLLWLKNQGMIELAMNN